jgi:hypothetical protein
MDMTPGDSPELRSHGATLRLVASDLRALVEQLGHRIERTDFQGPAGDRLRTGMTDRMQRLRGVARELEDLADVVAQDAMTRPS